MDWDNSDPQAIHGTWMVINSFNASINIKFRRKFLPTAEITKDWKIAAMPPLREVDLVQVARELNINAAGKKPLKNRDAIARFVKAVLLKARFYNID